MKEFLENYLKQFNYESYKAEEKKKPPYALRSIKKLKKDPEDTLDVQYDFEKLKNNVSLIALDIYKCYDNISLDILNNMIMNDKNFTLNEKDEWLGQLDDMRRLNYDFNGNIVYRNKGIPQGSLLSPYLCNYYITKIINDPEYKDIISENETTIYADNIFIVCKNRSNAYVLNLVDKYIKLFDKYKLNFNEPKIIDFDTIWVPYDMKNKIYNNNEIVKIKILGIPIIHKDNWIAIDMDEIIFKLPNPKTEAGYKANEKIKRFIVPKFRFYYEGILQLVSKDFREEYKNWFIKETTKYLQKAIINYKISKDYVKYIMGEKSINMAPNVRDELRNDDDDKPNAKFFSWWLKFNKEYVQDNVDNYKLINKLKDLADDIWKYKKKFDRHTIMRILKENIHCDIYKNFEDDYNKNSFSMNYNESFRFLDEIYLNLLTKRNIDHAFDISIFAYKFK